jgi:hypothetical protein
MTILTLIIAIAALAAAITALVRKPKQEVVKETTTYLEHPPVYNPFHYDGASSTYVLQGSLKVTGSLSCLNEKTETQCHTQEEK